MKSRRQLMFVALCAPALLAGPALAQTASAGSAGAPRMKAIVYQEYGSPDVLRLEEIPKPVPEDNQVLVKVRAASVNPLDWHYMRGTPFFARLGAGLLRPEVTRLGVDFAGTVEAVGKSVTRFKPGDEVFGGRTGAFGEYVTPREDRAVALKPPGVTFEQAAAVPIAAITALQALRDTGKLRAGEKVLVNGASGGVGTFAVQIAKALGAHVTGVCSTRNVEMVRSIGADRVVDYTREDFTQGDERYDLILDNVGNHPLLSLRRVLNPNGRYVMVGGPTGKWIEPLPRVIRTVVLSRLVSQQMGLMLAELNQKDLNVLGDLMRDGKVKPVIDRRYTLGQAPEAIRYLEAGHARGKVVIDVASGGEASPPSAKLAPSSGSGVGPVLVVFGVLAFVLVAPVVLAVALNRRFQRHNPGKRPYRWGYYVSIMALVGGIVLGVILEGVAALIVCSAVYAVLAWFFAQRRRWAWVALTILTLNPVAWIVNLVYLRKRWAEDAGAAPIVSAA